MENIFNLSYAEKLDREDPLAAFRSRFFHGEEKLIYLDGNSLGRMPIRAQRRIREVTDQQWGERLIRGWNEEWIEMPKRVAEKIARLTGALEDEVLIADSTSVNLFKLAVAALRFKRDRKKIVSDTLNFPSDLYILQGAIDTLNEGHTLHLVESDDDIEMKTSALEKALDENTALLTLSHVAFKSAFKYDMKKVTELAHELSVPVLWDLSHSAGALPIKLNECHVDLAVGCTYKYLNGGPGSPAFLYVHRDLQEKLISPLRGWFGDARPFSFEMDYKPAAGINRFNAGTPGILSLVAVENGVDVLLEAGIEKLWEKAQKQLDYMRQLINEGLSDLGFKIATPADHGSHLALRHKEAYRINRAMIEGMGGAYKIIPDFREPDIIRLGVAPVYTRYSDILRAIKQVKTITEDGLYKKFSAKRVAVT